MTATTEPDDDLDAGALEERTERHLGRRFETLAWYHALGMLLARMQAAADYGDRWQKKFTAKHGVRRDTVYKALKFAELFTTAEAGEWEDRIDWPRLSLTLSVGVRRRRLALLRRAVKENLSHRALSAAIGALGTSHLPRGGPRRGIPLSKGRARDVAEYLRRVERVLDHHAALFARAGGTLDALRAYPDEVGPRLRKKLERLLDSATSGGRALAFTATAIEELLALLPDDEPKGTATSADRVARSR